MGLLKAGPRGLAAMPTSRTARFPERLAGRARDAVTRFHARDDMTFRTCRYNAIAHELRANRHTTLRTSLCELTHETKVVAAQ
jgi:hypothetical protein